MGITAKNSKNDSEKTGKTVCVDYDGFRLFSNGEKGKMVARSSLNCSCADGVLQGGIGYEFYRDRNGEKVLTAFVDSARAFYILETWSNGDGTELSTDYFILDGDGQMYQYVEAYDGYVAQALVGLDVGVALATTPNGETKIVVSGEQGAFCVDGVNWGTFEQTDADKCTGAVCFSKNRVFLGQKPCKLLYGDPEKPWDFTATYDEGGYVYLPLNKGDIVDILEYGDSVYIFFQRGIVRLKPDGLARNFQIRETTYSGGEIFAKSIGVCGNWIFFLSENGICRFDGEEVERVGRFLGVMPAKVGQRCAHATVGEYYLLKYLDEGTFSVRTVALRADGKDGYFVSNYAGLNECNRMPVCAVGNRLATLRLGGEVPNGETRVFESDYVDLGGRGKKHLKSVTFYGEGRLTFEVFDGKDWTSWDLEDIPLKTTLKLGVVVEEARFRLLLDTDTKIRRMSFEYERLD